jgi:hypothetical protein
MENNPTNADAPVTKASLKAEFGKFEEKMEQLLADGLDPKGNQGRKVHDVESRHLPRGRGCGEL